MNAVRFGGVVRELDGSFSVICAFSGLSWDEAEQLSAWLERLVATHLHEIAGTPVATVPGYGHA